MGILSTIFGTPSTVSTIADTVKSGVGLLDNAFYTEQEKSAMALESGKLWLEIQKVTASENSLRSITRRIIAVGIVGTYLLSFFAVIGLALYKKELADIVMGYVTKFELAYLTMGVCSFYFVFYGIKGIKK